MTVTMSVLTINSLQRMDAIRETDPTEPEERRKKITRKLNNITVRSGGGGGGEERKR